jgi:phage repressor protein C with HTH and peptisase S24 domain
MSTLAERIRECLRESGAKQAQLARIALVKPSSVSDWLSGETKTLSTDPAIKLSRFFGVNIDWLTTGKGLKRNQEMQALAEIAYSNTTPGLPVRQAIKVPTEEFTIPHFDTGGKMGNGLVLKDQPGVIEEWRVSREWLSQNVRGASAPGNLCIVTGFGDSMAPMFRPGDPLVVDLGVREVLYDAVYFFRVEGEGFIKRLQRIPGHGLLAISENKSYRDWNITQSMDFEVFGRVLKAWSGHEL